MLLTMFICIVAFCENLPYVTCLHWGGGGGGNENYISIYFVYHEIYNLYLQTFIKKQNKLTSSLITRRIK